MILSASPTALIAYGPRGGSLSPPVNRWTPRPPRATLPRDPRVDVLDGRGRCANKSGGGDAIERPEVDTSQARTPVGPNRFNRQRLGG